MGLVKVRSISADGSVATISCDTREDLSIDFAERVKKRPKLKPFLTELGTGGVVDGGIAVEWLCGIDIDAQSLHRSAHGMAVRTWRKRHRLSQKAAGEALGITGRMIRLYESGAPPMTKTITLAMRGDDALRGDAAA